MFGMAAAHPCRVTCMWSAAGRRCPPRGVQAQASKLPDRGYFADVDPKGAVLHTRVSQCPRPTAWQAQCSCAMHVLAGGVPNTRHCQSRTPVGLATLPGALASSLPQPRFTLSRAAWTLTSPSAAGATSRTLFGTPTGRTRCGRGHFLHETIGLQMQFLVLADSSRPVPCAC